MSEPLSNEELRQQIRDIIHGDTPDHFMSDGMIAKPDKILDLIATQNTALLKEVTDYFYWRIDCNTLISELEGWRGCIDNAKDQTERHFNSKLAAMGEQ